MIFRFKMVLEDMQVSRLLISFVCSLSIGYVNNNWIFNYIFNYGWRFVEGGWTVLSLLITCNQGYIVEAYKLLPRLNVAQIPGDFRANRKFVRALNVDTHLMKFLNHWRGILLVNDLIWEFGMSFSIRNILFSRERLLRQTVNFSWILLFLLGIHLLHSHFDLHFIFLFPLPPISSWCTWSCSTSKIQVEQY